MSAFHPGSAVSNETAQQPAPGTHSHEPVLITEQQVRFGTAAALGAPTRRGVLASMSYAVSSAAGRWRARSERRRSRHYPARLTYLEDALMSREMDRL